MNSRWVLLLVSLIIYIVFTTSSPLGVDEVPLKRFKRAIDDNFKPKLDFWPTSQTVISHVKTLWKVSFVVIPSVLTIALIVAIIVWYRRRKARLLAPKMIVIEHNQPVSMVANSDTHTKLNINNFQRTD